MTKLILDLLKNCIEGGLDIANGFSLSFISLVFRFEDTFWSSIGVSNPINTAKLSASILTISLSLITYLRWTRAHTADAAAFAVLLCCSRSTYLRVRLRSKALHNSKCS